MKPTSDPPNPNEKKKVKWKEDRYNQHQNSDDDTRDTLDTDDIRLSLDRRTPPVKKQPESRSGKSDTRYNFGKPKHTAHSSQFDSSSDNYSSDDGDERDDDEQYPHSSKYNSSYHQSRHRRSRSSPYTHYVKKQAVMDHTSRQRHSTTSNINVNDRAMRQENELRHHENQTSNFINVVNDAHNKNKIDAQKVTNQIANAVHNVNSSLNSPLATNAIVNIDLPPVNPIKDHSSEAKPAKDIADHFKDLAQTLNMDWLITKPHPLPGKTVLPDYDPTRNDSTVLSQRIYRTIDAKDQIVSKVEEALKKPIFDNPTDKGVIAYQKFLQELLKNHKDSKKEAVESAVKKAKIICALYEKRSSNIVMKILYTLCHPRAAWKEWRIFRRATKISKITYQENSPLNDWVIEQISEVEHKISKVVGDGRSPPRYKLFPERAIRTYQGLKKIRDDIRFDPGENLESFNQLGLLLRHIRKSDRNEPMDLASAAVEPDPYDQELKVEQNANSNVEACVAYKYYANALKGKSKKYDDATVNQIAEGMQDLVNNFSKKMPEIDNKIKADIESHNRVVTKAIESLNQLQRDLGEIVTSNYSTIIANGSNTVAANNTINNSITSVSNNINTLIANIDTYRQSVQEQHKNSCKIYLERMISDFGTLYNAQQKAAPATDWEVVPKPEYAHNDHKNTRNTIEKNFNLLFQQLGGSYNNEAFKEFYIRYFRAPGVQKDQIIRQMVERITAEKMGQHIRDCDRQINDLQDNRNNIRNIRLNNLPRGRDDDDTRNLQTRLTHSLERGMQEQARQLENPLLYY